MAIGFIELIFNKKQNRIISFFLIINGCLLRKEVVFPVLISIGIVYFIKTIKLKDKRKNIFSATIIFTIFITIIIGRLFYTKNETLQEFYKWQQASINLRDYKPIEYNNYKEIFEQCGWTRNDKELFYSWGFADKEKYSIQNLEKISSNVKLTDKYNLKLTSIIKEFFSQFYLDGWNQIYIFIFIFLFIISLIKCENKKEIVYIFISTILVNILLIVRQRNIYRVVFPQYLISCLYYIYLLKDINKYILKPKWQKILGLINVTLCLTFFTFYINNFNKINNMQVYNRNIIEQISNDGNLYIVESGTYNKITMNYNILERRNIGEYKNIVKAGGGDCFSQRYYNYVKNFELQYKDNLYKNLTQDNVYYIGEINDVIITYMKENVDSNKSFVLYTTIEDINIYKYI